MNLWQKLRMVWSQPKCIMCKAPLKGERAETCSPNCDEWCEQRSAW